MTLPDADSRTALQSAPRRRRASSALPRAGQPAGPRSVLVIDGNPPDRQLVRDYLRRVAPNDWTVLEASSGAEGLVRCREKSPPDCILLALDLPDLDGLDVLDRLRPAQGEPPFSIIVLTEDEESDDEGLAALRAGAHEYLSKSCLTPQCLRRAVANAAERRQLVERLHASQRRYDQAMQAVTGVVWEWDVRTDRVERSAGLRQLLGVAPEDVPPTRDWWLSRIHPDDAQRLLSRADDLLGRATMFSGDYRVRHADGRWIDVWERGLIERDAEGQAVRLVGFTTDVSARKRAEEAGRQGEALYRALAAHLPNGAAFVVDRDLRYRLAAGEALATAGFTPADFEGKTLAEALPPEIVARYGPHYEQALAGKPFEWEHSNHQRHYVSRGVPLHDAAGEVYAALAVSYDITERKQTEERLRESEERFRSMADGTPVMIWVTDVEGRIQFINHAYQQFFGVTLEEVQTRGWQPLVHPDDASAYLEAFFAALRDCTPFHGMTRVRRADGQWRWLESVGQPRYDAAGKCVGFCGSSPDVTERKEAEARLRVSEERFRQLMALLPVAVYTIKAPTGEITYYNEQAATLWGRRPAVGEADERFCGSFQLWTPDGSPLPHNRTPMTTALTEGRSFQNLQVVIERPPPDSSRITVLVNIEPIRDESGAVVGAINVFHDVTALHAAEQALRASESRYRLLADSIPQIAWTATAEGTLDFVNARWAEFSGRSLAETQGEAGGGTIHPDDAVHVADCWREAVRTKTPFSCEFRCRTAAGAYRRLLCRGVPVLDAEGRVWKWFGTSTDIEEQKLAEEVLREADRRKDEFLGMLGHELRNPLGPIRNAVELLRRRTGHDDVARQSQDMIERQVAHMARLIDDLLDATRIARGKILLRQERCDLAQIARQTAEDYRGVFAGSGVDLVVDAPAAGLWVEGDPTRLAQMVGNLLHNAHKFTDPGGRVTVAAAAEDGKIAVRVRDSGVGIEADLLPRLFETFSQADRTLERNRGGLGLGLALVKGLAELHGGSVTAASAGLGHGAEFTLRLPAAMAPAVEAPVNADEAADGGLRILIIEDNRDAARSLQLLLKLYGHEVETAADGPTGIALTRAARPQVVLCDIGLPGGLSGFDVARQLRSDPALAACRLIALTGYGRDDDQRQTEAAGFDLHLTKPVDLEQLRRALAGVRGASRATS